MDPFSSAVPITALQETQALLVNAIRLKPTAQNIRLLLNVSKTLAKVRPQRQRRSASPVTMMQSAAAQPAFDATGEARGKRRDADAGAAEEAAPLAGAVCAPAPTPDARAAGGGRRLLLGSGRPARRSTFI
jgi:hypothetical protein